MTTLMSRRLRQLHVLCEVVPDLLLLHPLAFAPLLIIRIDGLSRVGVSVFTS
jgi:hypothetical protein